MSQLLKKILLNTCLELLNNDYVRKITIFKIEAGIMTLNSHHYRKEVEKKLSKSFRKKKKRQRAKAKSKTKAEFSVSSSPGHLPPKIFIGCP